MLMILQALVLLQYEGIIEIKKQAQRHHQATTQVQHHFRHLHRPFRQHVHTFTLFCLV